MCPCGPVAVAAREQHDERRRAGGIRDRIGDEAIAAKERIEGDESFADVAAELDRIWAQVRPLYEKLHCHVRAKLAERYGGIVDPEGPIPAHLLGNIWAQTWANVYDLAAPAETLNRLLAPYREDRS